MYSSPPAGRERKKKKIIGQYSKISKISSQPAPRQDAARVCSSRSLLLIPSSSNCFCYACSGKIKVSFVRTSQLDSAVAKKNKEERERETGKKKTERGGSSLPNNWRRDVVIQERFHHSIFYCVSRAAPLFIITCHCVISNSLFHGKQKWFCSVLCSPVCRDVTCNDKKLFLLCLWYLFFFPSSLHNRRDCETMASTWGYRMQMVVLNDSTPKGKKKAIHSFLGRLVHPLYFIWQLTNSNCNQIRSTCRNPMRLTG